MSLLNFLNKIIDRFEDSITSIFEKCPECGRRKVLGPAEPVPVSVNPEENTAHCIPLRTCTTPECNYTEGAGSASDASLDYVKTQLNNSHKY